jgi:hypothetical protein
MRWIYLSIIGVVLSSTAAQAHSTQSRSRINAGLPQRVGQCVNTMITSIADRFGEKINASASKDGFDPGTAIQFANGGSQVSYEKETVIIRSRVGDQVYMCLRELPRDCPPGDNRGRIYNTKNLRTGEAWTLPDSQHSCGGA